MDKSDEQNGMEEKQVLQESLGLMPVVEALLKKPGELVNLVRDGRYRHTTMLLFWLALACYLAYGAIMGGFSGHPQWLAAAAKVAVGMLLAGLLLVELAMQVACRFDADVNSFFAPRVGRRE